APEQTRIFGEIGRTLVDLNLAYATLRAQAGEEKQSAYELAAFYFPPTIEIVSEMSRQPVLCLEVGSQSRRCAARRGLFSVGTFIVTITGCSQWALTRRSFNLYLPEPSV